MITVCIMKEQGTVEDAALQCTARDLRHGIEIRQFKFTLLELHSVGVGGAVRDSWR